MLNYIFDAITTANEKALAKQEQQRQLAEYQRKLYYCDVLQQGLYSAIHHVKIGIGIKPVEYLADIHPYPHTAGYVFLYGSCFFKCCYGILTEKTDFTDPALEIFRDRINHAIRIKRKKFYEYLCTLPESEAWLRISENLALYYGFYVVSIKQENDEIILSVIMPAF